jgi:hypothetical protein
LAAPSVKVVPKLALLHNTALQNQIFPGLHGISVSFPLIFVGKWCCSHGVEKGGQLETVGCREDEVMNRSLMYGS